jgi:hypothetical protein
LAGKEQLEVAMAKGTHRQRQPGFARGRPGELLFFFRQNGVQGFVFRRLRFLGH